MAWYSDSDNVRALGQALLNAEVLSDTDDFLTFLKKPMQYKAYYEAWEQADFPTDEDDDGWDQFVESVSEDTEDESEEDAGDET